MTVKVIGAGLAGCEPAHQLSRRGIKVHLYEMKPNKYTPAHSYSGFAEYGLNIVAAFDENDAIIGTSKSGKPIMHLSRLGEICRREQIKIGIITVPAEQAQGVCDLLISNGILAIWNFAPKHLNVPDHILVQNENMAASLALLCKHLNEQMKAEE